MPKPQNAAKQTDDGRPCWYTKRAGSTAPPVRQTAGGRGEEHMTVRGAVERHEDAQLVERLLDDEGNNESYWEDLL